MVEHQQTSLEIWAKKYCLKDGAGNPLDDDIKATYKRVAKALAEREGPETRVFWENTFYHAMNELGVIPAGRILANVGSTLKTSTINCVVSSTIRDSMDSILANNYEAGMSLKAGSGIGYEFSTLRPKNAFVTGAGAKTSGPLSFMDIFDRTCFTVASAGGRRGAQMGTFDISHPDVEDFITVKHENGRLRQFNLSLLITKEFMDAVKKDEDWDLVFPIRKDSEDHNDYLNAKIRTTYKTWPYLSENFIHVEDESETPVDNSIVLCKVYKTVKASALFNRIMRSTYDYAEPGFILIDKVNEMNNNWFCENIRASNPCGEQMLPPNGSCLLGSINLTMHVRKPFTKDAHFDFVTFAEAVRVATRMLDNVVEINGLPLISQQAEIIRKRRHGLGYMGLGSALTMMCIRYGSDDAIEFTRQMSAAMTITSYTEGLELAVEKGPAPIMDETFTINDQMFANRPDIRREYTKKRKKNFKGRELFVRGKFFEKVCSQIYDFDLKEEVLKNGMRFTHATSIAPTGCCVSDTVIRTTLGNVSYRELLEANNIDWKEIEKLDYKQWFNLKPFTLPSVDNEEDHCDKIWYNGHEEVVELEFEDGHIFKCTLNHKLLIRQGNETLWVEAQYLKGDEDIISY